MVEIENWMVAIETDAEYSKRMMIEAEERLEWEAETYDYWEEREKEERCREDTGMR